jgi:hypothetical protein
MASCNQFDEDITMPEGLTIQNLQELKVLYMASHYQFYCDKKIYDDRLDNQE